MEGKIMIPSLRLAVAWLPCPTGGCPLFPHCSTSTTTHSHRQRESTKQSTVKRGQIYQATRNPFASALSRTTMPELPEVENFRRLLLPLVSKGELSTLTIECPSQSPPRTFITPEQVKSLNGNCCVKDVLRKGKLICMVMECVKKIQNQDCTCNIERFTQFQYAIHVLCWHYMFLMHSHVVSRCLSLPPHGNDGTHFHSLIRSFVRIVKRYRVSPAPHSSVFPNRLCRSLFFRSSQVWIRETFNDSI